MNNKIISGIALLAVIGAGYFGLTQSQMGTMPGMDHSTPMNDAAAGSTKAFETAMASMMKNMAVPYTGDPDLDFYTGMIPHHQGAVEMSQIVLKFGKDAEMRTLATEIIAAQEREISEMKASIAAFDKTKQTSNPESIKAYQSGMSKMMGGMMIPYTGNADVDFAKGMIPHHEGAISMAKTQLQFGTDLNARKLSEAIISSQTREIARMTSWLAKNGN